MKIAFFGAEGKVGRALVPVLEGAGHEVRGIELGDAPDVGGLDAAVDFTSPTAAPANARAVLEQGVSCIVGTTGLMSVFPGPGGIGRKPPGSRRASIFSSKIPVKPMPT